MTPYSRTALAATQITAFLIVMLSGISGSGVFAGILAGLFLAGCIVLDIRDAAGLLPGLRLSTAALTAATEKWLASGAEGLEAWVKGASPATVNVSIAVTAGLTLFLELTLIRWEAGLFPVFSMYKNFALLGCFCGIGLGYALARETRLLLGGCLPVLALLLLVLTTMRYGFDARALPYLQVVPVREETAVFFDMQSFSIWRQLWISMPVYALLGATFVMNALVLLPGGQFCGRLMMRARPLPAYGYNLLGSIAGIALLFGLSWLWAGPVVWFGLAAAVVAHYLSAAPAARRAAVWSAAACVIIAGWPATPLVNSIYSPYQLIQQSTRSNGLMEILAGGSYYQKVFDLGPAHAADPALKDILGYYDLPFRTARSLKRVAIVGAGSGNDVAAALRNGAGSVDAVEIDPAIRALGLANHPEHPYQNPRTNAIIDDARSFFRTASGEYDAIVYGVLDSHVVVANGSNMRVDSFVYTREGLRDAFAHVGKGGLMSVSFALLNHGMGEKIFRILKDLPGASRPVAVLTRYDSQNTTTFMVGKDAAVRLPAKFMAERRLSDVTQSYAASNTPGLDLPTDDWPFFYMNAKMYPATYVVSLALMLVLALILVRRFLPARGLDAALSPFLFLGGGFMLVETKAITELSLLFGNTWRVVGVTIIGVLVMAWLANLAASRLKRPVLTPAYIGLLVAIAAGYAIARHSGIGMPGPGGKIAVVALLTCPLFFSGFAFSALLAGTKDLGGAMAYNLMGAMLGGVLEYNAMQFGFSSLYLIAIALYALAWLTSRRKAAARGA